MGKPRGSISKARVDRAGDVLRGWVQDVGDRSEEEGLAAASDAYAIASKWRQTFAYPLALVTPGIRNWVDRESSQMVVGQRLKRMPQIVNKLLRFDTMRLSQMEDIAGCRAVLANGGEIEAVARRIEQKWDVRYARTIGRTASQRPATGLSTTWWHGVAVSWRYS